MNPGPSVRWRRFLIRWSIFLLGFWLSTMLIFKLFENSLVYPGMTAAEGWAEPSDPATKEIWLTSSDGTKIHAWYLPCQGATGAVHFSHGNGGNLSHRDQSIQQLRDSFGRSVLVYDYPGYGHSEGRPTEAGIYSAAEAAWDWLKEKYPEERIVLFGESLGGGVAVELATRHDCAGLVLFSTFASLPKAAKAKLPWLPCETLMSNRFDNAAKLPGIRRPVFITHGDADEVIPIAQAEVLFEIANEPKRFYRRLGGTHNRPYDPAICKAARLFLEQT